MDNENADCAVRSNSSWSNRYYCYFRPSDFGHYSEVASAVDLVKCEKCNKMTYVLYATDCDGFVCSACYDEITEDVQRPEGRKNLTGDSDGNHKRT